MPSISLSAAANTAIRRLSEDLVAPGVVEVVTDYRGNTFRAVYTVRYADAVYVLHAFQKKSSTGRQTSLRDIDSIRQRLREVEQIAKDRRP